MVFLSRGVQYESNGVFKNFLASFFALLNVSISYGYERHYDPSIFRPIFMYYCSSVNILYIGN